MSIFFIYIWFFRAFGSVLTVTAVLNRAVGWRNFTKDTKRISKVVIISQFLVFEYNYAYFKFKFCLKTGVVVLNKLYP